jgi:hypothetical protein
MRIDAERIRRAAAWALCLMAVCGVAAPVQASDPLKVEALKRGLADMVEARRLLSEKAAAGAELSRRLQSHRGELRAEIVRERQLQGIGSFSKALQVERIGYNLRLIQRIDGYLERIERRIGHFRSLDHALEFNMRSAQDELLALATLEDRDIAQPVSRIRSLLNEVAREAAQPLFNAADPPSGTVEAVWNGLWRPP